jgi:XTP/dITP diphosphohydrolase
MHTPTQPRKVLIASTNVKKAGEMIAILQAAHLNVEFVTLANFRHAPPVEETGETFAENARLKAEAGSKLTGLTTIADDGGLCIDYLGGSPGVKSHRFLGAETGFDEKMARILEMLAGVPADRRTCRFQCAVAIRFEDGRLFECMGSCEGVIGMSRRGARGFGYDPIFYLPQLGKSMAELTPIEKQMISHRGKALAEAIAILRHKLA